jgi:hypothetical protein
MAVSEKAISTIQKRIGAVYLTDDQKAYLTGMIEAAEAIMKDAGWPEADLETPKGIEAIAIYVKMSLDTDANAMKINPVWLALVGQARGSSDSTVSTTGTE